MKIRTKLILAAMALIIIPMSLSMFLPSFILGKDRNTALRNQLFKGLSDLHKTIESITENNDSTATTLSNNEGIRANLYVLNKFGKRLDPEERKGFRDEIREYLVDAVSGDWGNFAAVYDSDGDLVTSVTTPTFKANITRQPRLHKNFFAYAGNDLLLTAQRPMEKNGQRFGTVAFGMVANQAFMYYLFELVDLEVTFYLKGGHCLGSFCGSNQISPDDLPKGGSPRILGRKDMGEETYLLAGERHDFSHVIVALPIGSSIKATNKFILIIVSITLFSTLIAVGAAFFWSQRSIMGPIRKLIEGTRKVGSGELDTTFHIRTGDEIQELADSFNDMTQNLKDQIKRLAEVTATQECIQSELRIAHDIQMGILPKVFPPFPHRHEFDIYASLVPATEVGGDLYDFFFMDNDRLCLTVGDVAGKGVPAALFMAVTDTLVKRTAAGDLTSDRVLNRVNEYLSKDNSSCMFVTLFFGILNTRTGELDFSNGGHNPPYLIQANGEISPLETTHGMALGMKRDFIFQSKKMVLQEGETLFLYTDGITEARNEKRELFSTKRLEEALAQLKDRPVRDIAAGVMEKTSAFSEAAPQSDDITILVLRYNGDN